MKKKTVDQNMLRVGLSPLHEWISLMKCLLHISYRLDIKSWQVREEANKAEMVKRKKYIQERFRNETRLLVDFPKPNSGNYNDETVFS